MPLGLTEPNVHPTKRVVVVLFLSIRTQGVVFTKSTLTTAMEEFVGDIGCVGGIEWLGTNTPCDRDDTTGSYITMRIDSSLWLVYRSIDMNRIRGSLVKLNT